MTTLAMEQLAPAVADLRILRAQSGDLDAFNDLVRENEGFIYSVCYRIIGDASTAEDATQETFIAAWRHVAKVNGTSFRPWLWRIAVNASKTQLRKRRRRAETTLEAIAEREASDATPEAAVLRAGVQGDVAVALAKLSIGQREAVVLWHQAGLDYQEIARVTHSSLGTVKSRLYRGRKRLSQILSPRILDAD